MLASVWGISTSALPPSLTREAGDQWSFFRNLIKLFFLDTLILKIYFFIIKINNFRGDLRDISAKTATLLETALFHWFQGQETVDSRLKQCLRFLFICLLLFLPRICHRCKLAVMKRSIVWSIDATVRSNSATAAYHWIEENAMCTVVKSLSQTDNLGSHDILCISWVYFAGNVPRWLTH